MNIATFISASILCYILLSVEEKLMEKLTGKGLLDLLADMLNEQFK